MEEDAIEDPNNGSLMQCSDDEKGKSAEKEKLANTAHRSLWDIISPAREKAKNKNPNGEVEGDGHASMLCTRTKSVEDTLLTPMKKSSSDFGTLENGPLGFAPVLLNAEEMKRLEGAIEDCKLMFKSLSDRLQVEEKELPEIISRQFFAGLGKASFADFASKPKFSLISLI